MNTEYIKNLLENYWNCETSDNEEQILKDFFARQDIPAELLPYKSLFKWQAGQAQIATDIDFEKRILSRIQPQKKGIRFSEHFYSFMKIAASILLFITFGTGIYTQYKQNKEVIQSYSETFSEPEEALRETQAVLDKISASFSKAPIIDSIDFEVEIVSAILTKE